MRKPAIGVACLVLACAVALIAADRPQTYSVRDVQAADVQSVTIARHPVSGWIETWVCTAYTTTGVTLGTITDQQVVTGPPAANQINALITARLNQLNARLDAKYPPGGPPHPLAGGGDDPGRGGSRP